VFISRKSLIFTDQQIFNLHLLFSRMQKRIIYHIAFWIVYLLFKTFMNIGSETDPNRFVSTFSFLQFLAGQAALLVVKIPMVYTLFFIADQYLLKKWSSSKTALAVIALYVIALALFTMVVLFVVNTTYGLSTSLADYIHLNSIIYNTFILTFTCSIALALKLTRKYIRQKETEQSIVKTKLETELQYLKAQINPHFLFNTLNNIYALARKKSDDTADVVVKLSKLLRFILYEAQKKEITLAEELQVLQNYIELERIRYNEKLKINFTQLIDDRSELIAPLILLPFVENAFKHGVSESRFNSYINLDIRVEKGRLYFFCSNSKADNIPKILSGEIGLGNIRRQLELLYPDHLLTIDNNETEFKVVLELDLNSKGAL
jgi:LytS/YehU family sensor histidine kinase